MAKKKASAPVAKKKTGASKTATNAPAPPKAVAPKAASMKKTAKKQKKVKRAAREQQVLAAVDQFHKDTVLLGAYTREFFNALRKSGVELPVKSRKALSTAAQDLRRTARSVKKVAGK